MRCCVEVTPPRSITCVSLLPVICCLVLGRRMGYLTTNRQNAKFMRLAEAVKESFVYIGESYFGLKLWKYVPTRLYSNFVRCEEIIYE